MPTYKVKSGDLNIEIETGYDAEPMAIAILAVDRAKPKNLGQIIEVNGGEYVGGNTTYCSTIKLLEKIGFMQKQVRSNV